MIVSARFSQRVLILAPVKILSITSDAWAQRF